MYRLVFNTNRLCMRLNKHLIENQNKTEKKRTHTHIFSEENKTIKKYIKIHINKMKIENLSNET